ncbi:MAG: FAD-dependent oxidoreductase, partial [Nanoarchaeota archaeon]|nr:FAD-dependent oxidoreductase [Nanoarchaeota archaeon]
RKLFIPISFVEKISLPIKIRAAIKYENQAQFHPLKYLVSLATKIPGDESYIFENTKAINIEEQKNICQVMTEGGTISAKYVVVATHFPFYDPAYYFARMHPSRSYALGIKIKNKFPDAMFINIEGNELTYRNYIDKRKEIIIISGGGHRLGAENEKENYRKIENNVKDILFYKKTVYYWSTHDNMTIDRVPYIGKISSKSNNVFVATGFMKWGMTASMVSAMIISDLIENGESRWQDIYNPSRFKPMTSAKSFIKQNLEVAGRYVKGRILPEEKKILPDKEGGILETNGKKLAVYKDGKGNIHSFNPYCTHMGCLISWNSAEKSWDCPCHGSRFTADGKIINGPALKDLKKED